MKIEGKTLTEMKNTVRELKKAGIWEYVKNRRVVEYVFPEDTPYEVLVDFPVTIYLKCGPVLTGGGLSKEEFRKIKKKDIEFVTRAIWVKLGEAKRLMKQYGGSAEVIHYHGGTLDNERGRTKIRA